MLKAKPLKIVAVALSASVLTGALVYYNFIDKATPPVTYAECPDFTVSVYTKENGEFKANGEQFTFSENLGKVMIINFWATNCSPCKAELPDFDKLQKEYPDDLIVLALDGEGDYTDQGIADWINDFSTVIETESYAWKDFDVTFGRYDETTNDVYKQLGFGNVALPSTMIVDREGKVRMTKKGKLHYEDLKKVVEPLIEITTEKTE